MKVCKILQTLLWLASRLIWLRSLVTMAGLLIPLSLTAQLPLQFHWWDEVIGSEKNPLKSPDVFGIVDLESGGQRLFVTSFLGTDSVVVIDVDADGSMNLRSRLTGDSEKVLGSFLAGEHYRALPDGSWQLILEGYLKGVYAVVEVAANGTLSWVDELRDSESTPMKYPRTTKVRPLPDGTLRIMAAGQYTCNIVVLDVAENGTVSWVSQLDKHQAPLKDPFISEVYQLADGEFRLFVSGDESKNIVVADVALNGTVSLKGVVEGTHARPLKSPTVYAVHSLSGGGQRVLVADYDHSLVGVVGVVDVAVDGSVEWRDYVKSSPDRPLKKPNSAKMEVLANGDWRVVVGCFGSHNIAVFDVASNGTLSWKSQIVGHKTLKWPTIHSIRTLKEGVQRLLVFSSNAIQVVELSANGTASLRSYIANTPDTPMSTPELDWQVELNGGTQRLLVSGLHSKNIMVVDVVSNGTAVWRGEVVSHKVTPLLEPKICGYRDIPCNRTRLFVSSFDGNNVGVIDFAEREDVNDTAFSSSCLPFPTVTYEPVAPSSSVVPFVSPVLSSSMVIPSTNVHTSSHTPTPSNHSPSRSHVGNNGLYVGLGVAGGVAGVMIVAVSNAVVFGYMCYRYCPRKWGDDIEVHGLVEDAYDSSI